MQYDYLLISILTQVFFYWNRPENKTVAAQKTKSDKGGLWRGPENDNLVCEYV